MYYVKKILALLATLLLVTMLSFFAFSVIPGDAAAIKLGTEASPKQLEALREEMGLNENVAVRYVNGWAEFFMETSENPPTIQSP